MPRRISIPFTSSSEPNQDEPPTTLFQPPSSTEISQKKRFDAQFGPLVDPNDRYVSKHHGEPLEAPIIDEPPYYYVLTTYISYLLLLALGHIRDFFGKRFSKKQTYKTLRVANGYAPLNDDFDSFYTRRLKMRIDDCFARTSTGVPGRYINVLNRVSDDFNETYSSYNYLGFAQSEGPCANAVEDPRADSGTSDLVCEVEKEIASFVGKPAAMVFSMGFVTNASSFPALLNHASIRLGARLSGAVIRSFKHNDMLDLERKLREAIAQGQPRTHRLYSMEGTMCDLPGILNLKDIYNIGALGPKGRGVLDILMGTLTKSFGANGGYIAAEKHIIEKLKSTNSATMLGESPTPAVLMQILASLKIISGELRIAFNSRYLRLGLKRLGLIVYGHDDSPIIPVTLHEMLKRRISVVVVARFCVSAAHNKDDMDRLLAACDEVGDILQLKFSTGIAGGLKPLPEGTSENEKKGHGAKGPKVVIEPPRWTLEEVIARGSEDAKVRLR
ncbi:serine palmitoyltransferase 2 [Daldinia bambusicola]|nr:serine palmitoyltransferase 2 [Daldinia bambusicola]